MRLGPLAFIIFHRDKDISVFGSGNSTQFIALCLVSGGGEIEPIEPIPSQHRRIIVASGVEDIHPSHLVARTLFLDTRGRQGRGQPTLGQLVVWHRVEHRLKLAGRLFVCPSLEQLPSQVHPVFHPCLPIAHSIAIGTYGTLVLVDSGITTGHLQCHLTTLLLILGRGFLIGLPELLGRIIILTDGKMLLTILDVSFHAASHIQ